MRHEAGAVLDGFINDMDTLQQAVSFALIQIIQVGLLIVWRIYEIFSKGIPFSIIKLITLALKFIATR